MQRGKPLQRRTPLASGKPLAGGAPLRRTPMKQGTGLQRSQAKRKPRTPEAEADAVEWQTTRLVLHIRAGGLCELCATPITVSSMEGHHRRSRGVKHPHRHCPCNALALCGGCHHGPDVHHGPERALELGTIISRHSTTVPAEHAVVLRHGTVHLDCRGGFVLGV